MSDNSNGDSPIHRIIYRDVLIEIWLELRGGTCCGLEHDPGDDFCTNCRKPLKQRQVHTISINGTWIAGVEIDDEAQAIDLATRWVDHIIEFSEESQDGNFEDEDYDKYNEEDLIDEDPDDGDEDSRHIDLANPPNEANESSGSGWGEPQLMDIIRQMKKLKWIEKAISIVKGRSKDPPTENE